MGSLLVVVWLLIWVLTWPLRARYIYGLEGGGKGMNLKNWRCWFRHRWWVNQVGVTDDNGCAFVLAWKQCERCAASKIVHVLR